MAYQPYGMDYLKTKLSKKRSRVLERYKYYEMKKELLFASDLIPKKYKWMASSLGWSAKAVDSIADRLSVHEFRNDNMLMWDIYKQNNADILFNSAMLSALISSCSFIYITPPENGGLPQFQVIDGANATGIIDDVTWMLKEGYAVLQRDNQKAVTLEAYFETGRTTFYYKGQKEPVVIENSAPYPLLVPIINRPDAVRPFGHSRISRSCMDLQQSAMRTLMRSEISAEFYSVPQKYVLGLDSEAEFNNIAATYSNFLRMDKDDDGNKPTVGQFTQSSMTPLVEQMRMFASIFAGETGLTIDDLGFASVNPSSADAIKASHENLRLTAKKSQKTFEVGFKNAGYLACCLRDDYPYERTEIADTVVAWEPMFVAGISDISSIGDALIKLQQSYPDYITAEKIYDITGI